MFKKMNLLLIHHDIYVEPKLYCIYRKMYLLGITVVKLFNGLADHTVLFIRFIIIAFTITYYYLMAPVLDVN